MYYIYSLLLALLYIGYYIIVKYLLAYFTIKEVIFLAYSLSFLFVLIFFNSEIINLVNKVKLNKENFIKYSPILLFPILMIITNYIGVSACSTNFNYGKIDSLAMSIYLPSVAILSFYIYNNSLSIKNVIGIILTCISIFLLL